MLCHSLNLVLTPCFTCKFLCTFLTLYNFYFIKRLIIESKAFIKNTMQYLNYFFKQCNNFVFRMEAYLYQSNVNKIQKYYKILKFKYAIFEITF